MQDLYDGSATWWLNIEEPDKRPCLRPNEHTIHPKLYVILVIFNTIWGK